MSDALGEFVPASADPEQTPASTGFGSFVSADSGAPAAVAKSPVADAILPQLASDPEGFDKAISLSRGDVAWALKTFKGVNPDTAAKVDQIAKAHQVPFGLVLNQKDAFSEDAEATRIYQSLSEKNADGSYKYPNTAKWLSDPVNMAKSQDDLTTLRQIEGAIRDRQALVASQGEIRAQTPWEQAKFWAATRIPNFQRLQRFWQTENEPLVTLPRLEGSDITSAFGNAPGLAAKVLFPPLNAFRTADVSKGTADIIAGVQRGVTGAAEFLATPLGIETMGTGSIPKLGQALISGAWATQMAVQIPDAYRSLVASVRSGDPQAIAENLTSGALQAFFIKESGKHAISSLKEGLMPEKGPPPIPEVPPTVPATAATTEAAASTAKTSLESQARIVTLQSHTDGLEELKSMADQSALAKRDPAAFEEFLRSNLQESGAETHIAADAQNLSEVFFQSAKTPEEIDQARTKLDQFAQAMGLTPERLNEAIATGSDIQVDKAALLAKYRDDPIFAAVKADLQKGVEVEKSRLQEAVKSLQTTMKDEAMPPQLTSMRQKMMAPKEEGGAGMSAEEADKSLALFRASRTSIAREMGQTLEEHLKQNPIGLEAGGTAERELFAKPGSQRELFQGGKDQTATPEFKKWFGESRVVDESGKPLVVYHGTHADVSEFKPNEALGGGIFFSPDPKEAGSFASAVGANIVPVYLRAEKVWPRAVRSYDEAAIIAKAKERGYDAVRVKDAPDGVVNWVVFHPEQIKSAIGNRGTFDPNNPNILFQGENRGAFDPVTKTIHLFATADRSTFLHETLHDHLDIVRGLIAKGTATERMVSDFKQLTEWAGSKDGNMTREQEEKVANEFERYLMSGKAPSVELTGAFQRFRQWLSDIYRSVKSMQAPVNKELQPIFERMLASESEIKEAHAFYGAKEGLENLLTEDEPTRAKLRQQKADLNASEVDRLTRQKMAAYFKANEGRSGIEKQVGAEVDKEPHQQALATAAKGKIDITDTRENFGEKTAQELAAKYPAHFAEDGQHTIANLAAEHGLEPSDLIDKLRTEPRREDAVRQRTDERIRMAEQDIRNDVAANQVTPADGEVHTEKSLSYLVAEAQALADSIAKKKRGAELAAGQRAERLTAQAYREVAQDHISRLPSGEATRYDRFANAERKWGRETIKALQAGDKEAALEARKKQLLNHALVTEAVKARKEVSAIQKRYAPKRLESSLKGVENEYVAPVIEALSRYGLTDRKNEVPYDFAKLRDLDENGGLSALLPDFLAQGDKRGDYRQLLTLQNLRDLDGAVRSLLEYGSDRLKSLTGAYKEGLREFAKGSADTMRELNDKTLAAEGTFKQKFQKFWRLLTSSTIQAQFLADMADNFSLREGKVGRMRELWNRMVSAEVTGADLQKEMAKTLEPHLGTLREAAARITKENGHFFDLPELPLPKDLEKVGRGKWTAERLITMMLNSGNKGNRQAMENAYKFGKVEFEAAAKHFTTAELKAIQGVLDSVNTLYPKLDAAHFEIYNRHIPKVEAEEHTYTSRDGEEVTLAGGYYPLKFDSEINQQAGAFAEEDAVGKMKGIFRSTKPEDGMTKGRVGGHAMPPLLSLDVLTRHLADTIHYITHSAVNRDWSRVTKVPKWQSTFTDKFGNETWKELRTWVKDQANARPAAPLSGITRFWDRLFEKQRGLATVAAFGLNLKTAVTIHHSMLNAGYALGWKWLASGIRDLDARSLAGMTKGEAIQQIADVSPWFKDHLHSWDRDVRAMLADVKPGGIGTLDKVLRRASGAMGKEITLKDARKGSMFLLTAAHQRMAAMFWRGAFNKYMGELADEKAAYPEKVLAAQKYADAMTQDLSSSSLKAELNSVQRDQGIMRFLTAFMGWNFKYGGRLQYEARAWQEGKISTKDYISHQVHETLAPALVRVAILGAMSATVPSAWEWMYSPLDTLMSWVPILKDVAKVLHVSAKQKKIDFDVTRAVPALEGVTRAARAGTSTWRWHEGTKEMGPMLWDWARATDYFTGTGATKPAQDLYRFYENAQKESE